MSAALRRIAGVVREESGVTGARGAMIERALSLVDPEIDAATAAARQSVSAAPRRSVPPSTSEPLRHSSTRATVRASK